MADERRVPVNPMPLAGSATRFADRGGALDGGFVDRLRDVCGAVTVDEDARTEAGRDWWPLAMMWARDGQTPARAGAIARPSSTEEVAAVLRTANDAGVPVTAMAGRSGVCGASVPVFGGVALDLTGLDGIVGVDDDSLLLDVKPGTWGDTLEDDLRTRHGVTLGHWPQSIALSTVGGWVACRSAGQYSTRYGKIEDMVIGLEVALASGEVIRTGGRAPRSAVGPDLTQLFVGSEGTLGVITEARLRVHPVPPEERRGAWSFASFEDGLEVCRRILRRGATPAVLRLYDHRESKRSFDLEGRHALIVLDEGDGVLADAVMKVVEDECRRVDGVERHDDELVERWVHHRNEVSGLADAINRDVVVDTCEVAARWSVLPALYRDAVAAVKAVPGAWVASAHQSHAYTDGACLYFTFAGQREGDGGAEQFYADAWEAVTRTTLAHGGALSHHHGIGLHRGRFMEEALGSAFPTLAAVKATLDPKGILNPGKLGLPSPFGPASPWPT
ncbi:MAG TPA: FAD-binding oxidoreductase [Acidimicrobiales bacterium]|nr:FAD-binding oxidoreductase [Acidimicrobiales bacterium]